MQVPVSPGYKWCTTRCQFKGLLPVESLDLNRRSEYAIKREACIGRNDFTGFFMASRLYFAIRGYSERHVSPSRARAPVHEGPERSRAPITCCRQVRAALNNGTVVICAPEEPNSLKREIRFFLKESLRSKVSEVWRIKYHTSL